MKLGVVSVYGGMVCVQALRAEYTARTDAKEGQRRANIALNIRM